MIHKAFWKIEHPPYNGAESIPESRMPSIQWYEEHSIFLKCPVVIFCFLR
jgi:hypothetical protein